MERQRSPPPGCEDGSTPLHLAMKNGLSEVVSNLLEETPVALNARDYKGRTPLHRAVACVDNVLMIECARLLKNRGATIDAGNQHGSTPLHLAAKHDRVELVRFLVDECEAKVDVKDKYGRTPLHRAASMCGGKTLESIRFLLSRGASLYVLDVNGNTPISYLQMSMCPEMEQLLADYNINENSNN